MISSQEAYEKVQSGEWTFEEFKAWVETVWEDGFESGYFKE